MKNSTSQEIANRLGLFSLFKTFKRRLSYDLAYVDGYTILDNVKDVSFHTTVFERPKGIEIIFTSNKSNTFHFGFLFNQIIVWRIQYTANNIPVLVILGIDENNKDFKILFKVKNYKKVEEFFNQMPIKKLE